MINELSTEACPADQYGTDERGRVASLCADLEDRYELPLGDGIYVGLCHSDTVQVEVKYRGGWKSVVNQSPAVVEVSSNISDASVMHCR